MSLKKWINLEEDPQKYIMLYKGLNIQKIPILKKCAIELIIRNKMLIIVMLKLKILYSRKIIQKNHLDNSS